MQASPSHPAPAQNPPHRAGLVRGETLGDPLELIFSSSGRLGRLPFIAVAAGLGGLSAVWEVQARGPVRAASEWLVWGLLVVCGGCVTSKRLHDLGKAGWWSAAGLGLGLLTAVRPVRPIALAATGLAFAALASLPGRRGANRFGP